MKAQYFNSKIDWWIPVVVIFSVAVCFIGPLIDGEMILVGAALAAALLVIEIAMFASVKYRISDGQLGIRNFIYRWDTYPIDKITEVRKTRGFLSAPALSTHRLSIKFSDKRILKSAMPLEVSPKLPDEFIAALKQVNPDIIIK